MESANTNAQMTIITTASFARHSGGVDRLAGTDAGRIFVALQRCKIARYADNLADKPALADIDSFHHTEVGFAGNRNDRSVDAIYC